MIAYIKGILEEKQEDMVIIDVQGIGYSIRVPASVAQNLPAEGEFVKLYTYLQVREDAFTLYGFLTKEDLRMFKLVIGVSGIGPKGGMALLSALTASDLRFALMSQDAKTLSKAQGIGQKTAQRMILELKDKIPMDEEWESQDAYAQTSEEGQKNAVNKDAVLALTALGYTQTESMKAVAKIGDTEHMDVEAVIKAALRYLF